MSYFSCKHCYSAFYKRSVYCVVEDNYGLQFSRKEIFWGVKFYVFKWKYGNISSKLLYDNSSRDNLEYKIQHFVDIFRYEIQF